MENDKEEKPDNILDETSELNNNSDLENQNEDLSLQEENAEELQNNESEDDAVIRETPEMPDDVNENFEDIVQNVESMDVDDDSSENGKDNPNQLVTVRPVKFKEFENVSKNRTIKKNYDIMQDIKMHVSVELGRAKSSIKDVIDFTKGSIIELDKIAGEQVEVFVNEKLVAKGEVIVIEDRFGVRITNTSLQKKQG